MSLGLPTEAYIAIEVVHDDGTLESETVELVPSKIGWRRRQNLAWGICCETLGT